MILSIFFIKYWIKEFSTKMEFRFIYFFLRFFKRFNYLPPSLRLTNFRYNDFFFWNYFFGSFTIPGRFLTFLSMLSKIYLTTWFLARIDFDRTEINEEVSFHEFLSINFWAHIQRFFYSVKFVFFFFFQKLNKNIYKFSNYRLSRFNMKLFYLPPYRRMRKLITFASKSIIYSEGQDASERQRFFFQSFFLNKFDLFFFRYTLITQYKIFKKHRNTLFLYSKLK